MEAKGGHVQKGAAKGEKYAPAEDKHGNWDEFYNPAEAKISKSDSFSHISKILCEDKLEDEMSSLAISHEKRSIAEGLRIHYMNMKDGDSGTILWESMDFDDNPTVYAEEMVIDLPKEILKCSCVSRDLEFSSRIKIEDFRLEQQVVFCGTAIERWNFSFGFVMPSSRNSWQQIIVAAPPDKMLSPEQLSGNVVFKTTFYDGASFLCKNEVRINYV
jgi:retinal rod rhodopsin-sensitive cGMP 3',5'-cyclic phosphodiesterase subunit delta